MKISQLIEHLSTIKDAEGDLDVIVEIVDPFGDGPYEVSSHKAISFCTGPDGCDPDGCTEVYLQCDK